MNPVAGIGGPTALKGSDAKDTIARAISAGGVPDEFNNRVMERTRIVLDELSGLEGKLQFITCKGVMGEAALSYSSHSYWTVFNPPESLTSAKDTKTAVQQLQSESVDILLFAGGDGTARDVCDAADSKQLVLGIPCGVKMHSGVFANTPRAAGMILRDIVLGKLTTVTEAEVRDIDEDAFRRGIVRSKYYGELTIPQQLQYIQQTKSGGKEVEALVLQEIAADIIDAMVPEVQYLIGSGSTTAAIMALLKLENTLLGVDVVKDGVVIQADATEAQLFDLVSACASEIIITVIGGQGHLLGRGNQQLSPRVVRAVGIDKLCIVATKAKLEALAGKPLIVDSGDPALDDELAGLIRVTTGYEDAVLCRVS
ncbi:MAG: ATP-NAD kinase family protein [Pseudomonadales bacterium]